MTCCHGHAFLGLLHLFRAHLQLADEADLGLALGGYRHYVSRFRFFVGVGEPAARGREAGDHERGAGEHEADGSTVYSDRLEGVRVLMYNLEVGNDRVVHVLVEEGSVVENVQRYSVGSTEVRE